MDISASTLSVQTVDAKSFSIDGNAFKAIATASSLGGIKIGSTLSIGLDGTCESIGNTYEETTAADDHIFVINGNEVGDLITTTGTENFISAIQLNGKILTPEGSVSSFYMGTIAAMTPSVVVINVGTQQITFKEYPTYGGMWHLVVDSYPEMDYSWQQAGQELSDGYWYGTYGDLYWDANEWHLAVEEWNGTAVETAQTAKTLTFNGLTSSVHSGESLAATGTWIAT